MSIITSASHDHPDHVALTIQIPGMSGSWTVYIPASDAADIAAARAVGDWPRQLAAAERGRAAMRTGRAFQEGAWPQTLALTEQAEQATAALLLDISRPVKQRASR